MISDLLLLCTYNKNGTKTACVVAQADAQGAIETFQFEICGQPQSITEQFAPNERKTVCVTHTLSGQCQVIVTTTPSNKTMRCFLDLDAEESCC